MKKKLFELDIEEFETLVFLPCESCGDVGSNYRTYKTEGEIYNIFYNGLDRIDSDLGYRYSNTQTLCKICNRMKSNLTVDKMMARAKKIANFGKSHQN